MGSSVIMDSLEKTREELLKEISTLSFEEFNAKPEKDIWSVAQNCHHLVLVELATVKVITWGIKEGKDSDGRKKDIQLALDRTVKIQAPNIVEPSIESFEVEQIIEMLAEARNRLLHTMSSLEDDTLLNRKAVRHPAFGTMSLEQWIELVPVHEQRHIAQIREALKK
jgi:uncharacterized damage-inducible protein DinB